MDSQPNLGSIRTFDNLQVVEDDSSLGSAEVSRGRRVDDSREALGLKGRSEEDGKKDGGEMVVAENVAAKLGQMREGDREGRQEMVRKGRGEGRRARSVASLSTRPLVRPGSKDSVE